MIQTVSKSGEEEQVFEPAQTYIMVSVALSDPLYPNEAAEDEEAVNQRQALAQRLNGSEAVKMPSVTDAIQDFNA